MLGELCDSDFLSDLADGGYCVSAKYNQPTFRNGGLVDGGYFEFSLLPESYAQSLIDNAKGDE